MSEQAIYINGIFLKERQTKFGKVLSAKIKVDDFYKSIMQHEENGWVSIDIQERKTPTEKQTHYAKLDTWKPNGKANETLNKVSGVYNAEPQDDDLPF